VTYNDFVELVQREFGEWQKVDSTYRYGQCMFNLLAGCRPDIAERIRATNVDPFYKDYVSQDTWEFVHDVW
jgi:hypothetical protein